MLSRLDFDEKKIIMVRPRDGETIAFKNDNVVIYDHENSIKFQLSCYNLFSIYIIGGFTLTSGLIEKSKEFGFSIILFNLSFKQYAGIIYELEGNVLLRKKQYNESNSLGIAKMIVTNKLINSINTLKKTREKEYKNTIDILNRQIEYLRNNDVEYNNLLGVEGSAAKIYFKCMFDGLEWHGRQPRVKRDEVNLLLDIGYTVLFNYIEALLCQYGVDIYLGNLHKEFYKRKSLVCDIMEPFRCIVDYTIRKNINLGKYNSFQFKKKNSAMSLDWEYSSIFIKGILDEIINNRDDIYNFVLNYYRWIMKNNNLAFFPKVVLNDID